MIPFFRPLIAVAMSAAPGGVSAASPITSVPASAATYADLATLSDAAQVVVRVKVLKEAQVPVERAPGLAPGHARLYLEAQTTALLAGPGALPENVVFLADVPLDAKGKAPKLKKRDLVLFARQVPSRPGEIQLVAPAAHLAWTPDLDARLRPILTALVAADAPPRVTGVRDVLSSEGNLAGESETQMFLATASGEPAALTVIRRPGAAPRWGVSWSEIIDQSARAPQSDTLAWFRLACSLPQSLPASANVADDPADRARAAQDYSFVIQQLGPCTRTLASQGANPG